ncbi:MAG TPA: RNA polymerase sigma-54 factor, partial [Urbifossiella sp.]|nr:RNA polymerase sigma-54 factor [Urbifossiella sp.]
MSGMRFGMELSPQMHQKMLLAPRMIQSMEILQLPIIDLQTKIEKELQENPFLEQKEHLGDQDEGAEPEFNP